MNTYRPVRETRPPMTPLANFVARLRRGLSSWFARVATRSAAAVGGLHRRCQGQPRLPSTGRARKIDPVEQAGLESFPASDPPSFNPVTRP